MEVNDRLFFPVFEPPIPRNLSVMLVDLAVTRLPVPEFIGGQLNPLQQLLGRQPRAVYPVDDVINNLVSCIVRNPATG